MTSATTVETLPPGHVCAQSEEFFYRSPLAVGRLVPLYTLMQHRVTAPALAQLLLAGNAIQIGFSLHGRLPVQQVFAFEDVLLSALLYGQQRYELAGLIRRLAFATPGSERHAAADALATALDAVTAERAGYWLNDQHLATEAEPAGVAA